MKDQSSIHEKETQKDKWDRGRALFMESLYKPDHELRGVLIIRNVLMS